ncbi:hypothetical protein BT69DRAFT_1285381 [Atractiella rhizophila]|nr:hypothetical protein BT69DRAFT_1285381 [Atractiella rhizophila]
MSSILAPPTESFGHQQNASSASSIYNEEVSEELAAEPEQQELEAAAELQAIESAPAMLHIPPPPPSWSSPKLAKPIVIPEQTGQFGAPFSRCYPPSLELFRVGKDEFVDMIDRLNKVWAPSGFWRNVDVAGNVALSVPEPSLFVLGITLSGVAQTALRVSQARASNAFLKVLNDGYFKQRGLRVKVVGSKKVKKLLKADNWNDNIKMDLDFNVNSQAPSSQPSSVHTSALSEKSMDQGPVIADADVPPAYNQPGSHQNYYADEKIMHSGPESISSDDDHTSLNITHPISHPAAEPSFNSLASTFTPSTGPKDPNAWAKKRMEALGAVVELLEFEGVAAPPASAAAEEKKLASKFANLQARMLRRSYNGMQGTLEKSVQEAERKAEKEVDGKKREKALVKAGKQREKLNEKANKETERLEWIIILNVDDIEGWRILDAKK